MSSNIYGGGVKALADASVKNEVLPYQTEHNEEHLHDVCVCDGDEAAEQRVGQRDHRRHDDRHFLFQAQNHLKIKK